MKHKSGFTLIQLSIILTVASLVFVATLPGVQSSLIANATSVTKMNSILDTMRGYMAANGVLPCPADPTQAIGASNYGVAAANPGTNSSTGNCIGGTPAAAYADTTKNIAIGMVPVKTLGLSYADALDGHGRDITYVVDTNATGNSNGVPCWSSSSLAGAITVNDNGINYNTIAVLVSHGADGYGAWLPLSGTSGTATRFNNGSTDTSQAANAQVATGGGLTALTSGNFVSFVRKTATSTFDDNVIYKSNLYTMNTLPTSAQVSSAVTPPANGTYTTGNTLTFTIAYVSNVTVTGTPRLDLRALGAGSIGTSNVAYATYQSGSGTSTLTFQYTVQSSDSAPTSGLAMNSYIDLNGGTISGGSTCFTAPGLTGVLISSGGVYVADSSNVRVDVFTTSGSYTTSYNGGSRFSAPTGLFVDSSGNIWVGDDNNNVVYKLSSSGSYIATYGSSGSSNGQFSGADGVALDSSGNIFVADHGNNRVQKLNSSGAYQAKTATGTGTSQTEAPYDVKVDSGNNVWVADFGNSRVLKFNNTLTTSSLTIAPGTFAPMGLAFDSSQNLWIADANGQVWEYTNASGYTSSVKFGNGTFGSPHGIAIDASNNIWIADHQNNLIYKCTAANIGSCTSYGSGHLNQSEHIGVSR